MERLIAPDEAPDGLTGSVLATLAVSFFQPAEDPARRRRPLLARRPPDVDGPAGGLGRALDGTGTILTNSP